MSQEHFVPKCLWAGKRPNRTATVPAHKICNEAWTEDNEYFRNVLVAQPGVDKHPVAKRLLEGKVKRQLDNHPTKARRFFMNLRPVELRTPSGVYFGHSLAFDVDQERIVGVLQNVVRGIYYRTIGVPLALDTEVRLRCGRDVWLSDIDSLIAKMPKRWVTFGDDVFACRFLYGDRFPNVLIAEMIFYRRVHYYALALPRGVVPRAAAGSDAPGNL